MTEDEVRLTLSLSGDQFSKTVQYAVIVEAWDHKKENCRARRRWLSTFTQAERDTISSYYYRFYRWYLVTGVPERVEVKPSTITLLQRATNFFATI